MSKWKDVLKERLPMLGHRNWVVVADAALPEQIAGQVSVYADQSLHKTLEEVLDVMKDAKHVRPIAWLDAELTHLDDSLAYGIEDLRAKMGEVLNGWDCRYEPHESILKELAQASQTYTVFMIKTPTYLPYTSVFFELDCGYWTPEMEAKLRERMA